MPARYSRISRSTSSTVSFTTYLVPSTRNATVSGCASTRSIRSGLSANRSPFRRVTRITGGPLARWGPNWAGTAVFSSACPPPPLSRTARSPGGGDRAVRRRGPVPGPARACEGRGGRGPSSALEVDQVLEDLVGAGDHAAVGLEAALGDDQPGELLGEVDVGHLQRAGVEHAATTRTGLADHCVAGVVTDPEGAVAGLLESARVVERGHRQLADRLTEAVAVDAGDRAVVGEAERLQRAHREAVLRGGRDGVGAAVLLDPAQVQRDRPGPAGDARGEVDLGRCGGVEHGAVWIERDGGVAERHRCAVDRDGEAPVVGAVLGERVAHVVGDTLLVEHGRRGLHAGARRVARGQVAGE